LLRFFPSIRTDYLTNQFTWNSIRLGEINAKTTHFGVRNSRRNQSLFRLDAFSINNFFLRGHH
jgi:hypothetical protein